MGIRRISYAFFVTLTACIIYVILHWLANNLTYHVTDPFMDEKFHVPQAQQYCAFNFTYYDPKITTPPGLYLLTLLRLYIRDIWILQREKLTCDVIDLRRTNQLVAAATFITIILIQLSLPSTPTRRNMSLMQRTTHMVDGAAKVHLTKIILTATGIVLLPPLFSFHTLYYTDGASLFFVLLAYLYNINDKHLTSAIFGMISISFRQTNVVWVFYMACLAIIKAIEEFNRGSRKKDGLQTHISKHKTNSKLIKNLLKSCWPYAMVGTIFVVLVYLNRGLALGDRDAHKPRLHLAQMLYFLGFCCAFGLSWMVTRKTASQILYYLFRRPLTVLMASLIVCTIISVGRYAHPYLVADNRHVTNFLWRRALGHNSVRPYVLTIVYLMGWLGVYNTLRPTGTLKMGLLLLCTAISIIPSGLIEPRYFIIPFVFVRLNAEQKVMEHMFELAYLTGINLGMHSLFLNKTFKWADSKEVQRFIW